MPTEGKGIADIVHVFVSSSSREMGAYRSVALDAIREASMVPINFNDPEGAGFTQSSGTIFDWNRRAVMSSDVFVGLYGFGDVWRPSSEPELVRAHPEVAADEDKLIMEYEYEWAKEGMLHLFLFMRTQDTVSVPPMALDDRMDSFRRRLRARPVGRLTTPESFRKILVNNLQPIRPRVFLSYSRKDIDRVKELRQELREHDIHAWLDVVHIPGTTDWKRMIDAAIEKMDVMLVFVTQASLASEWVEKEYMSFLDKGKPVLSYICEPAVQALPPELARLQWISGTSNDGFLRLSRDLSRLLSI